MKKLILDVCCSGRKFWFNKNNPIAICTDIKGPETFVTGRGTIHERVRHITPDMVMDFRNLDFPDESFYLVIFDPPHLKSLGEKSFMAKLYGVLDPHTWRDDIKRGFSECFRVLKENGTLIFRWNEYDIPLREILKLTPFEPIVGHPSGKNQKTHWVCFLKTGK